MKKVGRPKYKALYEAADQRAEKWKDRAERCRRRAERLEAALAVYGRDIEARLQRERDLGIVANGKAPDRVLVANHEHLALICAVQEHALTTGRDTCRDLGTGYENVSYRGMAVVVTP